MKKRVSLILIIFLVFFIQFRLANALTSNECRHYEDGVCQDLNFQYIEASTILPSEQEIPTVSQQGQVFPSFFILIFQLIGIVTLFSLLIILVQEFIKSSKKTKKSKR